MTSGTPESDTRRGGGGGGAGREASQVVAPFRWKP